MLELNQSIISLTRARAFRSLGYAGEPALSARYLMIVEHSVRRKSPSSSTGTIRFGLIFANSGLRCSPVNRSTTLYSSCLLYTSDAADEEDSVDLGGGRIIK